MTKKDKYEKEIIELIKEKEIMRIYHIFPFYPRLKKSQFYNLKLDKSDKIKEALENNRIQGVNYLLKKWIQSDNATLQVAAMRLICSSEEHRLLNQNYIDHTTGGDSISINLIKGK